VQAHLPAAIALLALWNLVTWAVYRLDKARAARQGKRISERTLLVLAALGGSPGALAAVHAHRRRHKARKASFVVPLWLIAAAHAGPCGGPAGRLFARPLGGLRGGLLAWALWSRAA
jgi:uncharacterized membrane protein YsdA (DUF1294 family)